MQFRSFSTRPFRFPSKYNPNDKVRETLRDVQQRATDALKRLSVEVIETWLLTANIGKQCLSWLGYLMWSRVFRDNRYRLNR